MVVLNGMSRYHLAAEALRRCERVFRRAPALTQQCGHPIAKAVVYHRLRPCMPQSLCISIVYLGGCDFSGSTSGDSPSLAGSAAMMQVLMLHKHTPRRRRAAARGA
jgi:hypothetical protein